MTRRLSAPAPVASSSGSDPNALHRLVMSTGRRRVTAACWIAVTNGGRFAYSANTGSGTISGFAIHQGGLTLVDASGITGNVGAGTAPADLALSRDSKFLYVRAGGTNQIAIFGVGPDGSLSALSGWVTGLPAGNSGLAAR